MDEEAVGGISGLIGKAMMSATPWGAIIQGGLGVGQKIASAIQRRNARRDFKNMEVPSSVYAMLNEARGLTKPNLPWIEQYRSNALASAARAVEAGQRTSETASGTLGVLGRVYGRNYMDFERELALKGLEERRRGKEVYMQALNQLSDWEQLKWQYNELMPYYQKMNLAGQFDASGNMNIGSAIGMGVSKAGRMWESSQMQDMFNQWKEWQLGNTQNPNPSPYNFASTAENWYTGDYGNNVYNPNIPYNRMRFSTQRSPYDMWDATNPYK